MFEFGIKNVRKSVKVRGVTFDALKEDESILNNFPIYCLHIFIPGPMVVDETGTDKITSPENVYFIIKQITVASLIKAPFIEQFVKCGSLQAFSYKSKIRQEDFIALLPTGKLILYLNQNIAQSLLIKREPCRRLKKSNKRQRLDFQRNICPQSIRSYFENEGYDSLTCEPQHTCNVKRDASMPDIDTKNFDSSQVDILMEWMGIHICGISLESDNSDNFLLHCPEQIDNLGSVGRKPLKINIYEGFFDIFQVRILLEESNVINYRICTTE
ncbi:unnamed protein product [Larinioides sclopetarius]|uniref:Uncharacterized protein n=1 Tax=Larinioides sclopetarius TaxID=280406 RepID=A0AAV1Z8K6_9ARAC